MTQTHCGRLMAGKRSQEESDEHSCWSMVQSSFAKDFNNSSSVTNTPAKDCLGNDHSSEVHSDMMPTIGVADTDEMKPALNIMDTIFETPTKCPHATTNMLINSLVSRWNSKLMSTDWLNHSVSIVE